MTRPSLSKTRKRLFVAIAVVSVAVVLFAGALKERTEGNVQVPFSSVSTGRQGVKALFLTLDRLGYRVERSRRPLSDLPEDGMIVIIEPLLPVDGRSWERLARFMEDGGRVFWATNRDTEIKQAQLLRQKRVEGEPTPVSAREPTAFGRLLQGERFWSGARFTSESEEAVTHLGDGKGALLVSFRFGKGELIALADPLLLTNGALQKHPENINLFLAPVGAPESAGTIYFDEWHHGFIAPQMPAGGLADLPLRVWYAFPLWLNLLIVQAALVLGAWLYSDGKRLGPPIPSFKSSFTSADYVTSLADLYRRAGARRLALATLYRHFVAALTGRPGHGTAEEQEAILRLAKRRAVDIEDVGALLERCRTKLRSGENLGERELVETADQLDTLRKELKDHA